MTNEETIKILSSFEIVGNNNFGIPQMEEAQFMAIEALQENGKLRAENEKLKEQLLHSIDIACEGCPKDNLSACMQEHCIRWIAKNHRDTMKSTIKDYYVED